MVALTPTVLHGMDHWGRFDRRLPGDSPDIAVVSVVIRNRMEIMQVSRDHSLCIQVVHMLIQVYVQLYIMVSNNTLYIYIYITWIVYILI